MWTDNALMRAAGVPDQEFPAGALYVVGLPIGNMGDITLRGLWVLSHADVVAAEDTRETRKLLEKFGITAKLLSVREHNERHGADQIMTFLREGKRVALVTDAGTPAVSDPGARAVDAVLSSGFRVVPVPGASAVVTALSAAGLSGEGFSFVGFVPPKPRARREALGYWARRREPFVLYEAPHRVLDLLKDLSDALEPGRRVVVARELTKRFESLVRMRADALPQWAEGHSPRGEYVILVDAAQSREEALTDEGARWMEALEGEMPASRLAAAAARATGIPRRVLYERLQNRAVRAPDEEGEAPSGSGPEETGL